MKTVFIVLWYLLLGTPSLIHAKTINLNQQDYLVHKGFHFSWIENIPTQTGSGCIFPARITINMTLDSILSDVSNEKKLGIAGIR